MSRTPGPKAAIDAHPDGKSPTDRGGSSNASPVDRPVPLVAELTGVSKRYGATQALDNARLEVRRGTSHALVGRNGAGKSTLVGVLTGMVIPDSGEVRVAGQELSPADRLRSTDVACVYQHPQILDHLTVAENLFIGKGRRAWLGRRALFADAEAVLEQWGIRVDPRLNASQLVEIARALTGGPSLVILDEPTAQLDRTASERLFTRLEGMKAKGASFLFISHHLDEVFRICEEVTVMRNGRTIVSREPVAGLTTRSLVDLMVGGEGSAARDASLVEREPIDESASPVLTVHDLSSGTVFRDVSFAIRPGEILGLTGLAGSGKAEVGQAIVGLRPRTGRVAVAGATLRPNKVMDGIRLGIGFVPEDRHVSGFAPLLSIVDNITIGVASRLGRLGWINQRHRNALADRLITDLDIVPRRRDLATGDLSGGNQQKAVMGRALAGGPRVIVGITPTAGVDIASKAFLYARLEQAAAAGAGVLIVSDEIDELAITDRVLVMFEGRIRAQFAKLWAPADLIAAIEGVGLSAEQPTDSATNEGSIA
jgi:simple sugar transport system ATP-binding protein